MNDTTTLLVSQDSSLKDAVGEVVSSIGGCRLKIVADVKAACAELLVHDRMFVILVHFDGMMNIAGLTRIVQTVNPRRVATIVISEEENPKQALALTRLGVFECLSRPLNLRRLSYLIDTLTLEARYRRRAPAPEPAASEIHSLGEESPFFFVPNTRMGQMVDQIKRIAPLETTAMLGGETGTGKTHLAGVIHRLSPRRDEPFLTINCGALAANLIESEMFGHVRGAFTGADAERTGKFSAVGRGTLFLDEVDSLLPELQAKLLRVVEERVFEPVGSNRTIRLRARLIVASNRPLEREVANGRFRSDLFYRFNVVAFHIPPLRDHLGMIPILARSMLAEFSARDGRRINSIAPCAMQALHTHSWPGNIRELRNVIERAVALCADEVVSLDDLPVHFHMTGPATVRASAMPPASLLSELAASRPAPAVDSQATELLSFPAVAAPVPGLQVDRVTSPEARPTLAESKDWTELSLITEALARNSHNRLRAAAELGISRMTLYNKLHKYGLMGA